ncbi:MAG: hypothetical protein R3C01_03420 [Planctomycetaceae bacterium]
MLIGEIAELEKNHRVHSAAELAEMERRLDELAVKRSSLAKGMILLNSRERPGVSAAAERIHPPVASEVPFPRSASQGCAFAR